MEDGKQRRCDLQFRLERGSAVERSPRGTVRKAALPRSTLASPGRAVGENFEGMKDTSVVLMRLFVTAFTRHSRDTIAKKGSETHVPWDSIWALPASTY